jgi:lysine decarboxylase
LLERAGVVAEKASPNTLTFLTTLAIRDCDVLRTARATAQILTVAGPRLHEPDRLSNPYVIDALPSVSPTIAIRRSLIDGECVPIDEAIGRIAAERIEAYPPGTAVVFEGFRVTRAAVEWLQTVRDCGGNLVVRDSSLSAIRVLPEDMP